MKKKSPLQLLGLLLVLAVFAVAAWLLGRELQRNDLTFAKICEAFCRSAVAHRYRPGADVHQLWRDPGLLRLPGLSLCRGADFAAAGGLRGADRLSGQLQLRRHGGGCPPPLPPLFGVGDSACEDRAVAGDPGLTFWFGVFFISGVLFVAKPLRIPHDQLQLIAQAMATKVPKEAVNWFKYLFADSRPFGILLLLLAGAYIGASLFHRGSLKLFRWTVPVPPFRLTVYQIAIASADMLVAASVFYVLFPPIVRAYPYLKVLEVYLVVYVLIVLSHVPGGWGVLEAGMMTLLRTLELVKDPDVNLPKVFAAIIVFRGSTSCCRYCVPPS